MVVPRILVHSATPGFLLWRLGVGPGRDNSSLAPTVEEMIRNRFLRENMGYDSPSDTEKYIASATNRFRDSWYDVHSLHPGDG